MSKVLALVLLLGAVAFLAPAPGADAVVLGKKSKGPKSGVKSGSKGGATVSVDRESDCDRRRLRSRRGKGPKEPKGPKKGKKERQGKLTTPDDCPQDRGGPITGTLTTATTTVTLGLPNDSDRTPTELTDIANSFQESLDTAFASAGDTDTFILSITIDDGSGSPVKVTYEDYAYESSSSATSDGSGDGNVGYTIIVEYFTAGADTIISADVAATIAQASQAFPDFVSATAVTETTEEKTITPNEVEGTNAPVGAAAVQSAIKQSTKYVAPNYTAPTKQSPAGAFMAVGAVSIGVALAVLAVRVSRSRGRQDYETLDEEGRSFVGDLEAEIEPLVE